MEKLDKADEELKKSGQGAVSLTDPEARFMENKKKRKELSYNSQITVDYDSGIILANDVTQECTDHNQLQPQIELTEENLGGLPEGTKVSMDNGYFSGANLRYLECQPILNPVLYLQWQSTAHTIQPFLYHLLFLSLMKEYQRRYD